MNRRWIHLCIIFFLVLLYFRVVYLHPREMIYSPDSDLIRYHVPQRSFLMESLKRDGEIPLWLPWRWSGTPFQAILQSVIFYPLTWLSLPIPPDYSHGYFFLIHAVMAGIFMYLYLCEIRLSGATSLAGSIFYMFAGTAFCMYFYHHIVYVFSWTALLLFLAERFTRRPSLFYAALLGLVAAVQFLGCHPQFFTFSTCLLACYIACLIILRRREGEAGAVLKACGYLLVAFVLFLSIVAVQLLPSVELSRYLGRGGGLSYYEASYPLYYPWKLWRLISTPPGTSTYSIYFGFGISSLALWGMVLSGRRVKTFFALFAFLCIIYALGKFSPLFYLCYKLFPPFRYFHEPERSLLVFSYCWIVLAALGLDSLVNGSRGARPPEVSYRRSMRLAVGALLLSAPVFLLNTPLGQRLAIVFARRLYDLAPFSSPFEAHREEIEELLREGAWMSLQLFLFVAASYLLLCIILRRSPFFRKRVIVPLVACGVVAELFFVGMRLQTIRPEVLYEETAPLRYIKSQEGRFRVLGMGNPRPLPQFVAQHYGIELADGCGSSVLVDYLTITNSAASGIEEKWGSSKLPLTDREIGDIINNTVLDLLNVRFILSLRPQEKDRYSLRGIFHDVPVYRQYDGIILEPNYYVYENTTALPRAFVVPEAKVVPDRDELRGLIGAVDPRKTVLLERKAGEATGDEPFRSVPYDSYSPNEIELHVTVEHPAYLVLSEIWYPGWKAYDRGEEREVLRANYFLRGIYLEPGEHAVVFRFQPLSYRIGKVVSLLGLACSFVAILTRNFKRIPTKSEH